MWCASQTEPSEFQTSLDPQLRRPCRLPQLTSMPTFPRMPEFECAKGSMLLTLAVLNFRASGGRPTTVQYVPQTNTTPYSAPPTVRNDTQDDSRPNNALPDDPKPRNDQDSNEAKPYDQTAPDMNSGDDSHPKIDDGGKKPDTKPKSDDPIDLRGDGDGKAGDGGTSKTDPNDIH